MRCKCGCDIVNTVKRRSNYLATYQILRWRFYKHCEYCIVIVSWRVDELCQDRWLWWKRCTVKLFKHLSWSVSMNLLLLQWNPVNYGQQWVVKSDRINEVAPEWRLNTEIYHNCTFTNNSCLVRLPECRCNLKKLKLESTYEILTTERWAYWISGRINGVKLYRLRFLYGWPSAVLTGWTPWRGFLIRKCTLGISLEQNKCP